MIIFCFGGGVIEGFLIKPYWHWKLLSEVYPKQYGDIKGYFSIMFFGIYKLSYHESMQLGMPIFMDEKFREHSLTANNAAKRLIMQRTRIVVYLSVILLSLAALFLLAYFTK